MPSPLRSITAPSTSAAVEANRPGVAPLIDANPFVRGGVAAALFTTSTVDTRTPTAGDACNRGVPPFVDK